MQSFEGKIVLIDFKNVKRFTDIKNKHMSVKADQHENTD